ncbi:MAG: aldehyde dehydrogenase family protein [Dokdonella sp.]
MADTPSDTNATPPADRHLSNDAIVGIFQLQHAAAIAQRDGFVHDQRIALLETLRDTIKRRQPEIVAALAKDFRKPASEVLLTEIFPVLQEIAHTKKYLKSWMRPQRVRATLGVLGTRASLQAQPRGVCLIIAPWNYPFNLALGPLVSALAAGNRTIIKPSEMTPATSVLIASIVAEVFPADQVAVVEGDAKVAEQLLALPFDHIFFTGSPKVGSIVMAAAAKTLASVTLELGGKSPTIVGPTARLDKAVRNIVWGKFANVGQTCIAPDHVFVHRDIAAAFNAAMKVEIDRVYGASPEARKANNDYARVVNDRHTKRIIGLIDDAKAKGAQAIGGEIDASENFIAPTLLTNTTLEMDVSSEELFGPILPIIEYDDIDAVIARINANPKPLALYIFDQDQDFADRIVARTSSGSVCINITMLQFLHPNLPFGGVNNSGIGAAHGIHGFRAFSHERAVLQDRWSILHWLFPPYTGVVKRLIALVVRVLG